MKTKALKWVLVIAATVVLNGCISIPPLIQVEHKEGADPNRRLDDIEKRLERIEKKLDQR